MSKAGFTKTDFDGSADKLQKGDVVWRDGHTEIYIGDSKTVGAHEDTDGKDGDSKGDEVSEVPLDYGGGKYTAYYRLSDSSASDSSDSSSSDSGSASSSSDFKTNDVAIKIAKRSRQRDSPKRPRLEYWATCIPNPVSWRTEAAPTMDTVSDNGLPEAKSALGWTPTDWRHA